MEWVAVGLLIIGFIVVMPRDSSPGSVANRNVRQGSLSVVTTPGHRPSNHSPLRRVVVGLAMMVVAIGLFLIA